MSDLIQLPQCEDDEVVRRLRQDRAKREYHQRYADVTKLVRHLHFDAPLRAAGLETELQQLDAEEAQDQARLDRNTLQLRALENGLAEAQRVAGQAADRLQETITRTGVRDAQAAQQLRLQCEKLLRDATALRDRAAAFDRAAAELSASREDMPAAEKGVAEARAGLERLRAEREKAAAARAERRAAVKLEIEGIGDHVARRIAAEREWRDWCASNGLKAEPVHLS